MNRMRVFRISQMILHVHMYNVLLLLVRYVENPGKPRFPATDTTLPRPSRPFHIFHIQNFLYSFISCVLMVFLSERIRVVVF